jgi:glycosyltransferase involved in cell wall biosynthesis
MDRLRVAIDGHVVGRRQTGNETYIVNLADALADRDDVEPILFMDADATWPTASAMRFERLRSRTPFLRVPLELPIRARRTGAELLHVQYVAPPIPRLPIVTTIHDVSFEDLEGAFPAITTLRLKATVRLAAMRSSAVIASSSFTRDRILDHYGIDPSRVHVALLGVHPQWRPLGPAERAALLAPLMLPNQFVLAVGNVHPRKNLPRLIRAMQRVRSAGGDLELVLVGQRLWRAGDLDKAIAEVGASDWVRFTGYVSSDILRALYGAATLVAYPSLYEGFGLPVLEAMACGAPVVASATTSIPEVAGDAGVLVDPTDTEALASAIAAVATDQPFRERLRRASLDRAAQFTWEACAEATVGAYRAALIG